MSSDLICIKIANFNFILAVLVLLIVYYVGKNFSIVDKNKTCNHNHQLKNNMNQTTNNNVPKIFVKKTDVMPMPKKEPELKQQMNYSFDKMNDPMLINIPSRTFDTIYKKIGYLISINEGKIILPLLGRPLYEKHHKWQFYTMVPGTDIQLPISKDGEFCTSREGCNNLFSGDQVYVESYNDAFVVHRKN